MKVLLIAPVPPPYGGMALQAQQLQRLLQGEGLEVSLFPSNFAMPRGLGKIGHIPGLRTMLRALLIWPMLVRRVRNVDVVHVMAASWLYFFLVVYPAVTVGRLCGRRVIMNYRGGEAGVFFRAWGWLLSPAFRLASVVTAPSAFLATTIGERFGVPVSIVPNIVDLTLFTHRERVPLSPKLLVTRHLERIYDIASILRAFGSVQSRRPAASLWIAGDGAEASTLRGLVSELGLENVRFLGAIPHRELPAIYDACDIYVNASLVDNFPGALLEASASGLAVVTTGAGGIPYIFENGSNARIVPPGDWRALAGAIDDALASPAETAAMVRAAVAVARGCDWSEVRGAVLRVYQISVPANAVGADRLEGAKCAAG